MQTQPLASGLWY